MNKVFLLFLFTINFTFSQHEDEVKCGWYGKKTVEERNQMFPFNVAKKVVYISFYGSELGFDEYLDENGKLIKSDSLLDIHLTKLAVKVFSLKANSKYYVKEFVDLNQAQIDDLSNLAFNFIIKKRPENMLMYQANCYIPRNAILFLDSEEKVIAHTEICFECRRYYSDWDENTFDSLVGVEACDDVFIILKHFFKNTGIKYGITER
jgi:hypothetical protein